MSSKPPNRIAELRKQRGMTQQELAEAVGAHWITISRLERGKLPLSFEWGERIGHALDVGPFDVFIQVRSVQSIFADGSINELSEVGYFKDNDGKEDFVPIDVTLDLNKQGLDNWLIIDTDNFYPFLHRGDVVQANWKHKIDPDEFLGRLCLAETYKEDENKTKIRFGYLLGGVKPKTYSINIINAPPIRDVKLKGLAAVTIALFNPHAWEPSGEPS